jgi:hypothetical protein
MHKIENRIHMRSILALASEKEQTIVFCLVSIEPVTAVHKSEIANILLDTVRYGRTRPPGGASYRLPRLNRCGNRLRDGTRDTRSGLAQMRK